MWPYALSVFFGAFLLFQVQPLIGKYILPWFGGSPGVWTTCLLFFQTVLLAGYAYAHLSSTRLNRRQQAWTHLALLGLSLALLPIIPSPVWKPEGTDEPIGRILLLLTVTLGLPYFVLSATGPLMQHWFSQAHPGRSPYRLYALSNAGSLLALLSYPFFFEPLLSRQAQAWSWSAGLVVFTFVCGLCAWKTRHPAAMPPSPAPAPPPEVPATVVVEPTTERGPSGTDRALWLVLPALASILLLSTTNQLSQDIAAMPFLWVLPLALYLLTFILCFDHPRWYRPTLFAALLVVTVTIVCHLLFAEANADLSLQVVGYGGLLFVACMICHGELYRLKPPARYLTSYYLWIAAGGAIGGFLVAVVAPLVFDRTAELQIGLWALSYSLGLVCFRNRSRAIAGGTAIGTLAAFAIYPSLDISPTRDLVQWASDYGREFVEFYGNHWKELSLVAVMILVGFGNLRKGGRVAWAPRMGGFVMCLCLGLGIVLMMQIHRSAGRAIAAMRNFYGTLKVYEEMTESPHGHHYKLVHGVITHGIQFKHEVQTMWPTTYYGESSGVGLAFEHLRKPKGKRRIGLVGLGTGTLASYGSAGDSMRIYEINPDVERIAREHFTYLAESFAKIDIVLGDARLSMEHELAASQPQHFDLLALDAFSSDAIPVHLLTRESFDIYLRHLADHGIIAVHISNRYLDLQPVVEKLAEHFHLKVLTLSDDDPESWWIYRTKWMLVAREAETLEHEKIQNTVRSASLLTPSLPLWTDDHASILKILR